MYVLRVTGACLLVLAGILCAPYAAHAESVRAVVPTPPPNNPPTITSPASGITSSEKSLTIKGDCQANLIVKAFSNAAFSGSTVCKSDTTYELQIDLQQGQNSIVAKQYDALNQPSPDSTEAIVYYVPPEVQPALPGEPPATQTEVAKFALKIDYDFTLQSPSINQAFRLPIRFVGGAAPYAVNIDWGDGQSTLVSRADASLFVAEHAYDKPGTRVIKIRISDSDGQTASLQFVLIVNGAGDKVVIKTPFGDVNTTVTVGTITLAVAGISVPSIGVGIVVGRFLWKLRFLAKKP